MKPDAATLEPRLPRQHLPGLASGEESRSYCRCKQCAPGSEGPAAMRGGVRSWGRGVGAAGTPLCGAPGVSLAHPPHPLRPPARLRIETPTTKAEGRGLPLAVRSATCPMLRCATPRTHVRASAVATSHPPSCEPYIPPVLGRSAESSLLRFVLHACVVLLLTSCRLPAHVRLMQVKVNIASGGPGSGSRYWSRCRAGVVLGSGVGGLRRSGVAPFAGHRR